MPFVIFFYVDLILLRGYLSLSKMRELEKGLYLYPPWTRGFKSLFFKIISNSILQFNSKAEQISFAKFWCSFRIKTCFYGNFSLRGVETGWNAKSEFLNWNENNLFCISGEIYISTILRVQFEEWNIYCSPGWFDVLKKFTSKKSLLKSYSREIQNSIINTDMFRYNR